MFSVKWYQKEAAQMTCLLSNRLTPYSHIILKTKVCETQTFWLFHFTIRYIFSCLSSWMLQFLPNACTPCTVLHRTGRLLKLFILPLVLFHCKGLVRAKQDTFKEPGMLWWVHFLFLMDQWGCGLLLVPTKTKSCLELLISSWRRAEGLGLEKWNHYIWHVVSPCDFWCFDFRVRY